MMMGSKALLGLLLLSALAVSSDASRTAGKSTDEWTKEIENDEVRSQAKFQHLFLGFLNGDGGLKTEIIRKVHLKEPLQSPATRTPIALLHTNFEEPAAAPAAAAPSAAPAAAPAAEEKKEEKKEEEKKETVPAQSAMANRAEHYSKIAQTAAANSEQHLADAKNAFKKTAKEMEKAKNAGEKITNTADDIGDLYTTEKNRRKRKQREREGAKKSNASSSAVASALLVVCP